MLQSAYNNGAWAGPGIFSDAITPMRHALAYAAGNDPAIAYMNNTFGGQSFDADSVIVKFTYAGDANMDGAAGFGDLGLLLAKYGNPAGVGAAAISTMTARPVLPIWGCCWRTTAMPGSAPAGSFHPAPPPDPNSTSSVAKAAAHPS